MNPARVRLVVAAIVFAGWLSWLGYLAASKTDPVVVSRSQLMAATHFVVGEVEIDPQTGQPTRRVKVVEDLRPRATNLTGETVVVQNVADGRIHGTTRFESGQKYLLPLTASDAGPYALTRSPEANPLARPWAYRWDDADVRRQFDALVPPR